MKILFIVDSLALGGGAERLAVTLGNELHNKGHKIHYLAFQDKNPKYEFNGEYYTLNQYYDFNQPTNRKNTLKNAINFLKNSYKIKKICNKKNIDTVISVMGVQNYHAIVSSILGNKSKIIVTHHSNPEVFSNREKNVMKILYPKSDKVVCVSKAMENIFKKKLMIKNNILTIYNIIDLKNCMKLGEEKIPTKYQEIFNSGFSFINIGRTDTTKGQWFLIRSFKKVVDKYNNVKLFILGDGVFKKELEDLIKKLNLENNVFILGNQRNVFPFLKKSNCFVFSSVFEGMPFSLLEALSTNLPVISTDCKTGPREILCPDLKIDEKIEYPYFGKYGILTAPFNRNLDGFLKEPFNKELNFKTINKKPLSADEEMFADLMIKVIEEDKLREEYSNGLKRAHDFDKIEIMNTWEKNI